MLIRTSYYTFYLQCAHAVRFRNDHLITRSFTEKFINDLMHFVVSKDVHCPSALGYESKGQRLLGQRSRVKGQKGHYSLLNWWITPAACSTLCEHKDTHSHIRETSTGLSNSVCRGKSIEWFPLIGSFKNSAIIFNKENMILQADLNAFFDR